jgi:hypothetical protein
MTNFEVGGPPWQWWTRMDKIKNTNVCYLTGSQPVNNETAGMDLHFTGRQPFARLTPDFGDDCDVYTQE